MRQRDLAVVGCAHSSAKKTVSFRLWLLTLVLYVVLSLMELLGKFLALIKDLTSPIVVV